MAEHSLDQSDLDSKYFINRHVYSCPFCNRRNLRYHITYSLVFNWSYDKKCYMYIVICTSCFQKSMHLSYNCMIFELIDKNISSRNIFDEEWDDKDIDSSIFYSVPTSFFTIDTRIPNIIRDLITEAEGCQKMNHLTGASACMRKAIYELLVREGIKEGSYEEKIKSLKGKYTSIDEELFDILGHIQQMASEKVHELSWDKWDSSHITLILETTKEILREIYVRPAEKKQRRNEILDLRQRTVGKSQEKAPRGG